MGLDRNRLAIRQICSFDMPDDFLNRIGVTLGNVNDFFNVRDASVNHEMTEVIVRKEKYYADTAASTLRSMSSLYGAPSQLRWGFPRSPACCSRDVP